MGSCYLKLVYQTIVYIYYIKLYIYINYIHKVISDKIVVNVFDKKELTAEFNVSWYTKFCDGAVQTAGHKAFNM